MDKYTQQRLPLLHPKYIKVFTDFINEIDKTFNTSFRVVQGLRTFAEQQVIYDQPHDHKDNDGDGKIDEADEKVTNAKAGQSPHNYGLAVDIVPFVNGQPNWKFDFSKLVPIATKYGLYWGGNFKDYDHFEVKGFNWRNMLEKYNKKDFITGTRYINI